MTAAPVGGRVGFSAASRSLIEEDEIELTSVGVDIGSSTSHLLFSTLVLERADTRYVVTKRTILHRSDVLLTPYAGDDAIDADALGHFIEAQYAAGGLGPDDIDAGALILTGVAARRRNARAIGDLFAAQAGRFVALSAGDALETLMAAHGSGAVERSSAGTAVLNIDVGGGTTKIAYCVDGQVQSMTALDAGARLVVIDDEARLARVEPTGKTYLRKAGIEVSLGDRLSEQQMADLADLMADAIIAAARGEDIAGMLRMPPLRPAEPPALVTVSGGVSEFLYGHTAQSFGDLGPWLADALGKRIAAAGLELAPIGQGLRATVVGASQYTVQVSGSTIFCDPENSLPLRNLPAVVPDLDLSGDRIDETKVAAAVRAALDRLDLGHGETAIALTTSWQGSATFHRLRGLARGLIAGLAPVLDSGHPLVIVVDGDIGGLLGVHCRAEEGLANPIVSIDGIDLQEFDFIDIGEVLRATGAAPVVVKSLLFPSS